jgi:uncharacterized protein YbjT (DUF2867 family)
VRFLVTAATGRTSAGVVRHLRAAGEEVRGLVRDKDPATRTFDDLHGVDIVDGAVQAGLPHLVKLSSIATSHDSAPFG